MVKLISSILFHPVDRDRLLWKYLFVEAILLVSKKLSVIAKEKGK